MRRGTLWICASLLGAFLLGLFLLGCGGYSSTRISVTVSPTTVTVIVNGTQQFTATVTGATDTSVKWLVNDTAGGNSTVGTISTTGFYTAPATLPSPATVTVKATANADSTTSATATVTLDSGVRVSVSPKVATIGTLEMLPFTATVTNDTQNQGVTWTVTCTGTACGTVSPTSTASGVATTYTAPDSPPSPATVTITAKSVADTNHSASAQTTIVVPADPTLTAINPTSAAQGSLFQDVYLTGTNFISTTDVRATLAGGTVVPITPVTAVSSTLLRARISDCLLSAAGTLLISVRRQNGTPTTAAQPFTVVPMRPALVGASPDSATQFSAGAVDFNVNGGYFGTSALCTPPTSPVVTAEFDGSPRSASVTTTNSARQLTITIGGPTHTGDLSVPGLISVAVRNSLVTQPAGAPQQVAVTNFAVQPFAGSASVLGLPLPVGTQPGAVAVNTATGIAVVANRGSNNITLIALTMADPMLCPGLRTFPAVCAASITVGASPTGVAVDNVRNLAVVVNNGDKTVSIVNLGSGTVTSTINLSSVSSAAPFAVGVNPLTGRALVAHQSTNAATLIDLTTSPPSVIGIVTTSTGTNPQVAVEPGLNWAIVTPGGAGTLSIVDLGRSTPPVLPATLPAFNVVASVTLGVGVRGAAINPETKKALLTDPTSTLLLFFSVLDQTVSSLTLAEVGATAAAVNPLTDIGVTVNASTNQVSVIDPRTPARLGTPITVGTNPTAVAVDPGSNLAVVTNTGTSSSPGNTVSIISLGAIRPLHITQISLPGNRQLSPSSPTTTLTSTTDLPVTVIGKGFDSGSVARLDGTPIPTSGVTANGRQLTATVPSTLLAAPRRFALDVVNSSGLQSNVADLAVVQAVAAPTTGCTAPTLPAPRAVAIDAERNLAVVTDSNCNTVSLIDLASGTVAKTLAVGKDPQGVAVISRLGKAVVTNRGDNTASLVDLVAQSVNPTAVTVGTEPIGVAINQDTATAVVANSASNTVSTFSADTGGTATSTAVDQRPVAVAIDPSRNLAAVVNATQNNVDLLDLSQSTPVVTARVSGFQLPTAVVFDPVTRFFLVTSSLANNFLIVNPDTQQATPVRIGINPTSMAYNFLSSTLVTVNAASNTVSVMDFLDRRVRAVLGLSASPSCATPLGPSGNQQQPCGVEIHPRTNIAVMADGDNNRVLLMPLPH